MTVLLSEACGPQLVLDELNHRFLNSLQVISTLASSKAGNGDVSLVNAQRLRDCIGALGRLHRTLAGSEWIPFSEGCVEICHALTDAFGRSVELSVRVDEDPEDTSLARGLLLVMAELMTNALKHARVEPLSVEVALRRAQGGWSLLVASNTPRGSGRPRIAGALASWLGGELSVDVETGFKVSVHLPTRAYAPFEACGLVSDADRT